LFPSNPFRKTASDGGGVPAVLLAVKAVHLFPSAVSGIVIATRKALLFGNEINGCYYLV
jgi:hypothetical protein